MLCTATYAGSDGVGPMNRITFFFRSGVLLGYSREGAAGRLARLVGGLAAIAVMATAASGSTTHYVSATSARPIPPYSSWVTAATNIQDAVDAAGIGDTVLVADGVYAAGARATPGFSLLNRVVITNDIVVRSVHGPTATIIQGQGPLGDGAVRCVFMSSGTLAGFPLANGFTLAGGDSNYDRCGGGAYADGAAEGSEVANSIFTGNSAAQGGGAEHCTLKGCTLTGNFAGDGGGACYCTLYDCALSSNSATYGGGAYGNPVDGGTLNNCTMVGNSASVCGGGAYGCTLSDCIVYDNMASNGPNYDPVCALACCCTTPDPGGAGDFASRLIAQGIAGSLFVLVALMWFIPDTRIEKVIAE